MVMAAFAIGVMIFAQGVVGLVSPEIFTAIVRAFQISPVIYLAAIARVLIGVILLVAASASRTPRLLRGLGVLVTIGGLLTPLVGAQIAKVILSWWTEGGPSVVRSWACVSLLVGALVIYATALRRKHAA